MKEEKPFYSSILSSMTGVLKGGTFGAIVGGAGLAALASGASAALTATLGAPDVLTALVPEASLTTGAIATTTAIIGGTAGAALGGAYGAATGGITGWVNSRPNDELKRTIELSQAQAQGAAMAINMVQATQLQQAQIALAENQLALEESQIQLKNDWAKTTRPQGAKTLSPAEIIQQQIEAQTKKRGFDHV